MCRFVETAVSEGYFDTFIAAGRVMDQFEALPPEARGGEEFSRLVQETCGPLMASLVVQRDLRRDLEALMSVGENPEPPCSAQGGDGGTVGSSKSGGWEDLKPACSAQGVDEGGGDPSESSDRGGFGLLCSAQGGSTEAVGPSKSSGNDPVVGREFEAGQVGGMGKIFGGMVLDNQQMERS